MKIEKGVTIKPHVNSGQPGFLCMPLVQNLPEGKEGWKKVTCPICSEECWELPEMKQVIDVNPNVSAVCTNCSISQTIKTEPKMILLPPKTGTCPECGVDHDSELPHNKDSLYYQYKFYGEHGRWPTWEDAMAHCSEDIKEFWREELKKVVVRRGGFGNVETKEQR